MSTRDQTRPPSPADDSIIVIAPSEPSVMEIDTEEPPKKKQPHNHQGMRPLKTLATQSDLKQNTLQCQHRTQQSNEIRQQQSSGKIFLYCCETCKKKFSDGQKFQNHSMWHDSQARAAKMICLACSWSISDVNVSSPVSQHLFSNRHAINVAKKMSQTI